MVKLNREPTEHGGPALGGGLHFAYLINALKSILETCSLVAGASGSKLVAVLPSIRPLNFALATRAWSSAATSVNPSRYPGGGSAREVAALFTMRRTGSIRVRLPSKSSGSP